MSPQLSVIFAADGYACAWCQRRVPTGGAMFQTVEESRYCSIMCLRASERQQRQAQRNQTAQTKPPHNTTL